MKKKEKLLKINEKKVRKNKFNRIEWINYFNNELTIESISNQLSNFSKNERNNFKYLLTKNNYNILNHNSKNKKVIYITEEEFINFSTNHNLKINKNNDKKNIYKNRNTKIKKQNSRSLESKNEVNDNKSSQRKNNSGHEQKSISNKNTKTEINKTKYLPSYIYNFRQ